MVPAGLRAGFRKEPWRGATASTSAGSSRKPGAVNSAIGPRWRFVPIFFLWNPWWADLIIVIYAVAANVPCILAQRYNRLRFHRLLARKR